MKKFEPFSCVISPLSASAGSGIVPTHDDRKQEGQISFNFLYSYVVQLALRAGVSLQTLQYQEFLHRVDQPYLREFFEKQGQAYYRELLLSIQYELSKRIQAGIQPFKGQRIVHTAPHHDDILLGYHAYAVKQLQANQNFMLYMTNGSHGVADEYISTMIAEILEHHESWFGQLFLYFYQNCIQSFAQAFHQDDEKCMKDARHLIFCNIVIEIFDAAHSQELLCRLKELHHYVTYQDDRADDEFLEKYEQLKGRLRQSESDCKWQIMQGHHDTMYHLGSEFYDDLCDAAVARDIQRVVKFFEQVKPAIVTVALDLAGVGPSTHFISLQVIAKALKLYADTYDCHHQITILGYRNVWSNFALEQADVIVPVSAQELEQMEQIFQTCFATQKKPLYPCLVYDGLFSAFVRQVQEQQADDVKQLLGDRVQDEIARDMIGALFLKRLTVEQLQELV